MSAQACYSTVHVFLPDCRVTSLMSGIGDFVQKKNLQAIACHCGIACGRVQYSALAGWHMKVKICILQQQSSKFMPLHNNEITHACDRFVR